MPTLFCLDLDLFTIASSHDFPEPKIRFLKNANSISAPAYKDNSSSLPFSTGRKTVSPRKARRPLLKPVQQTLALEQ